MTELELLIDFHKEADRQGPGSTTETLKALSFIQNQNGTPLKVADIGCGTGAQTITLAEYIAGEITAVDLFPEFLNKLETESNELGLDHKIKTLKADMTDLPFQENEFDVIWSEGAIYFMGFEEGIKQWKKFLKPGGYLAVSEITWLTESRPKEIEDYWNKEYPQINTASAKIRQLEKYSFTPVGYFTLPEYCWIDNYYEPMEEYFDAFLKSHNHSEMAQKFLDMQEAEIEMYKKYKEFISYGFYVAKKA